MTDGFPKTLIECINEFSDADRAREFLTRMRWPEGVECPRCQSKNLREIKTRRLWVCKDCSGHNQFSVRVGSIFEDSPIFLGKWLTAIWLILNAKNGISSYEIHRSIGVTQKTAWFMLHRIRVAVETGSFKKLHDTVEMDETYIGGKSINMHKTKREAHIKGRGPTGEAIIMGLLERGGKGQSRVAAKVVKAADRATLDGEIHRKVAPGSNVFTDCLPAYCPMDSDYVHQPVDHAVE